MNSYYDVYYPDYLMHYGVKGMKWGHRKRQAFSVKAAGHRTMAKAYDINARTYRNSNKALSSMNTQAKNQQLKKAEQAQAAANQKLEQKRIAKANMTPEEKRKKAVKTGAAIAGTALAVYGAYKVKEYTNKYMANKEIREWTAAKMRDGMSITNTVHTTPISRTEIRGVQFRR